MNVGGDVLDKYRNVELRPWQKKVLDEFMQLNDDEILHVVIEWEGGAGKGFLMKYMEANRIAKAIPQDCVLEACTANPSDRYVIRLARATDQSERRLWHTIEQIKKGQYEETNNSCPKILVLSALEPPCGVRSEGMWKTMVFEKDGTHKLK